MTAPYASVAAPLDETRQHLVWNASAKRNAPSAVDLRADHRGRLLAVADRLDRRARRTQDATGPAVLEGVLSVGPLVSAVIAGRVLRHWLDRRQPYSS